MNNGFQLIENQLWISKDPEAQLFYTFDWHEWLSPTDTIVSETYTIAARVNDPNPLVMLSEGIDSDVKTYIELSGGQLGKSYAVSVTVTTANGLIDRRTFKVKVEQRSA